MSLRDVTITRDEEQGDRVRMTPRTGSFWEILKKVRELKLDAKRDGRLWGLAEARRTFALRASREMGAR